MPDERLKFTQDKDGQVTGFAIMGTSAPPMQATRLP
jgi:hypothetical protein